MEKSDEIELAFNKPVDIAERSVRPIVLKNTNKTSSNNNQFKKKLLNFFLFCGFVFLLTSLFTYPAITQMTSSLLGDGGDNYEYASYQGLAAQSLGQFKNPLTYTTFWRYPAGFDFARGFDSYLTVIGGAFLTLIFSLPASYNLSIFILFFLNALISFIFFRKLTSSVYLGIIGMIIYGFSFSSIARSASHPNLMFTGGLLLLATAVLELFQTTPLKTRHFLLFSFSILLTAAGSIVHMVFTAIFIPVFLLISFFFFPEKVKTTLLRILAGLLEPTFGKIEAQVRDLDGINPGLDYTLLEHSHGIPLASNKVLFKLVILRQPVPQPF